MTASETPSITGPTEPQAEPQPSPAVAPPTPAIPGESKDIRILRNLMDGLTAAIKLHEEAGKRKLFVIVSLDEESGPTLHSFDETRDLIAFLLPYQRTRAVIYVFYGQRWLMRPGKVWQLFDGQQYIPMVLDADQIDGELIQDGSMWVPFDDPRDAVPSYEEQQAELHGEGDEEDDEEGEDAATDAAAEASQAVPFVARGAMPMSLPGHPIPTETEDEEGDEEGIDTDDGAI